MKLNKFEKINEDFYLCYETLEGKRTTSLDIESEFYTDYADYATVMKLFKKLKRSKKIKWCEMIHAPLNEQDEVDEIYVIHSFEYRVAEVFDKKIPLELIKNY